MTAEENKGAEARATAREARDDADRAREGLRQEGAAARDAYQHGKERVREGAKTFARDARERAEGYADQQRSALSRCVGDYAAALRRAGQELEDRHQGLAARLTSVAADSVDDVSASIERTSPQDVFGQVRDFGRRNPAVFIAGTVLAGLALARFARSSEEHETGRYGGGRGPYDRHGHDDERRWQDDDRRWASQADPAMGAGTSSFAGSTVSTAQPSAAHPATGAPVQGTHPSGSGAAVSPGDPLKKQEN